METVEVRTKEHRVRWRRMTVAISEERTAEKRTLVLLLNYVNIIGLIPLF